MLDGAVGARYRDEIASKAAARMTSHMLEGAAPRWLTALRVIRSMAFSLRRKMLTSAISIMARVEEGPIRSATRVGHVSKHQNSA